jgi:transposase InsO family protein
MKIHEKTEFKYLLVFKDGFSGYCELVPCQNADHVVVAVSLLDWIKRFGVPSGFVSDQGTHFKNQVISELSRLMCVEHHFTVAYTPWSNGTVERLNKEIKRIIRVLLSDFRMKFMEWVELVPLVQFILNQSATKVLGDRAPVTVFTGLEPTRSLDVVFRRINHDFASARVSPEDIRKHVLSLRVFLEEMHADVQVNKDAKKRKNLSSQRRTQEANFDVGDYVLLSRGLCTPAGKLAPTWTGPYRITEVISDWVYKVQHLLTNEIFEAHARRLRFYADSSLNVTEDIRDYVQDSTMTFEIKEICDFRKGEEGDELFIHWLGFEKDERTWESFDQIQEAAPKMVSDFMRDRDS